MDVREKLVELFQDANNPVMAYCKEQKRTNIRGIFCIFYAIFGIFELYSLRGSGGDVTESGELLQKQE